MRLKFAEWSKLGYILKKLMEKFKPLLCFLLNNPANHIIIAVVNAGLTRLG
jgi:hypothetical protein